MKRKLAAMMIATLAVTSSMPYAVHAEESPAGAVSAEESISGETEAEITFEEESAAAEETAGAVSAEEVVDAVTESVPEEEQISSNIQDADSESEAVEDEKMDVQSDSGEEKTEADTEENSSGNIAEGTEENYTWRIEADGKLFIEGNGELELNSGWSAPWDEYKSEISSLEIGSGITSIGISVFKGCTSLASVVLPQGLSSIGREAFLNCTSLTDINIPSSVTSIGYRAFDNCTSLQAISIAGGISTLETKIFAGCKALTTVHLPGTITFIKESAFEGCSSLTDVYFDGSAKRWNALPVDINNTVLDSATIHFSKEDSSDETDSNIIWHIEDDSKLVIEGSGVLEKGTWIKYRKKITSLEIGNGITSIEKSAFENFTELTSVDLPGSLTSIGDSAFSYCKSLVSVSLPEGISSIGSYTFNNCTSLVSVSLPEGISSIGSYTFNYCTSLVSVDLPESLTSIGDSAFSYCKSLVSVSLPEGLTSVGDSAFSGCKSLVSVDLPESLTSIVQGAFWGCTSLVSVDLPESLTSIGTGAFGNCASLTEVIIPSSVTSIGSSAFISCSNLQKISISGNISKLENAIFEWCNDLTTVLLPGTITTIEDSAFFDCSDLTDVYFDGTEEMWNAVTISSGNTALESATIHFAGEKEELKLSAQPADQSVCVGDTAVFAVEAEGENLTYQWQYYKKGVWTDSGMTGSNTNAVSVQGTTARNGQKYRCVIMDASGNSVTSEEAVLTIAPKITTQPKSAKAPVGKTVTYSVKATGVSLKYQWQYSKNGTTWKNSTQTGSKTNSLKVDVLEKRDGYKYRCKVTDKNGKTVTSKAASLKVIAVTILTQPVNKTVAEGKTAKFTVSVKEDNVTYQWQVSQDNGATWSSCKLSGNKTAALKVEGKAYRSGYQYRCVIKDGNGNAVKSEAAVLTVS